MTRSRIPVAVVFAVLLQEVHGAAVEFHFAVEPFVFGLDSGELLPRFGHVLQDVERPHPAILDLFLRRRTEEADFLGKLRLGIDHSLVEFF